MLAGKLKKDVSFALSLAGARSPTWLRQPSTRPRARLLSIKDEELALDEAGCDRL